ncbi:NAD(P)/FAD-dependent oxidoreductase [Microbispora amethystogenes]|uniref:FAD-dependent oxidoreductase n=1 Tax=Microbispora amethystogenes TaxID=1427754 RepID=UPI0033CDFFA3
MTEHLPIAIVGGGLGGLTAAAVLHRRGIRATVLEREPHRHTRTQGGMLDIHDDTGQLAIEAAGLRERFRTLVHAGGEAMRIMDRHGTVLYADTDDGRLVRPEIDRGDLRGLLLDALPEGAVRWGSDVRAVGPVGERPGHHLITLADGTTYTTRLLIGADGAWSRVRPLLSDARPRYSGISFVEADLHDADVRHPAEAEAMGPGMLFALDGGTGILGHRESDGSLHCYLGHRADERWLDGIDFTDAASARAEVLKLLDGWAAPLRGMIAGADGPLVPRRIHALPVGHRWDPVPGVTLLGDAAHLMSPFAGAGANLALYDASRLADAITDHPGDADAALSAYETELFGRSEEAAAESARSLEIIFAPDAPHGLVEMFARFHAGTP